MEYDLFSNLLDKLAGWTNKKINSVQKEIYWNEISKVPDMAFTHIIEDLIKITPPSGKLPTPDQISLQWFHWLQAHPNFKQLEYPQTDCVECDGEGCFTIWYLDSAIPPDERHQYPNISKSWYKTFLPCSQCQNWRRVFPTRGDSKPQRFYTRQEIIDNGWRFTDPYLERYLKIKMDAREKIKQIRNLNHLAEQAMSKPQRGF